ncbi:MAG: hydantoinase/oxoprolinase family protein [Pseudomonadota bacterium]
MSLSQPTLRLAVDIGGTFTDTVLTDETQSVLASAKTLTTHNDPTEGALAGMTRVLDDARQDAAAIAGFIHGTTLATNALIEKRGACVATLTTEGFRDILEIGYERRYSQYDIDLQKTDTLVSRDRAFTIAERMSARGEVLKPLQETALPALLDQLDASGAEAVAICLMHAYANPAHEHRLRDLLQSARPDLSISLSSEVSPEAREYDRLCTTVANAYIQPMMARYLTAFAARFRAERVKCPILMMTASGGMCALEAASRFPIRLVESGPAGGAILAARLASEIGEPEVLSFDMGGTTAKLCLIDGARPQTSRHFEIARAARFIKGSGLPVRIPVIDMIEIGAGGGSVAAIDRLGRLSVGPESAGSEPGPAAFCRGGAEPTVTDADVALGYIRPDVFAEGQFSIDPALARRAVSEKIAGPLEETIGQAADGISRIVDENMANAARMHAVESGKDLSARTMIAFGGNGPLHACRVARAAGVSRIVIPQSPGVGSAIGFLYAPVSFETVRSRYAMLHTLDTAAINDVLSRMEDEARAIVRQGAPQETLDCMRSAFMRYHGQGHEIEVPLPAHALGAEDIQELTTAFERAYAALYSRPVPGMDIEILNWALRVSTKEAPPARHTRTPAPVACHPSETAALHCDVTGRECEARVLDRGSLVPGMTLSGPALVTEPQTTTFVGADFTLGVDAAGNLILTRSDLGEHA